MTKMLNIMWPFKPYSRPITIYCRDKTPSVYLIVIDCVTGRMIAEART